MTDKTRMMFCVLTAALIAGAALAADFDMKAFLGFEPVDARQALAAEPRTLFQTNNPYDVRIAIPVDGVIVHRHGHSADDLAKVIGSWTQNGFTAGRMFFADSDAGNHYTQGRFDGKTHYEDIELDRNGNRILCSGIRPYMLPTPGWTEYLKTEVRRGIDGGATAIYPEEPLAHNFTGYEESFKKAWVDEYGTPWQGGHESPDAFFKTARLKNKLYIQLEQDLCDYTRRYAEAQGKRVDFLVPIHSLFSNLSARLVAPLGTSIGIQGNAGYIGQIWTGPVRWTIGGGSHKEMTFFDSAYVNYDYFVNLVIDSDRRLYLLADPVEDDPRFRWDEYDTWYKECLAAKLMFTTINTYEVMPWPDRIYLPGHSIGGGTPGPADYRTTIMSCLTALQDVPRGTRADLVGGTKGIGMLVADSAMWQHANRPVQDAFMGLLIPLLKRGVPVSSVPMERCGDAAYMKHFRLLMLSFEAFKPHDAQMLEDLAAWVRTGGVLILFKTADAFDGIDMFWKQAGFASPQAYLCSQFGIAGDDAPVNATLGGQRCVHRAHGSGHVVLADLTPSTFVDKTIAETAYLPLVQSCVQQYVGESLDEPRCLVARRDRFVIAHTFDTTTTLEGRYVDIFSPALPLLKDPRLGPNTSMILCDVAGPLAGNTPAVLHSTYRLTGSRETADATTCFVMGPAGTDAAIRVYTAGRRPTVEARASSGKTVEAAIKDDGDRTVLVTFGGDPSGVGVKITWQD
ncbi:MAG: hypothetical protein IH624_08520 [Phycisphaerae bacterium]|nr:hypothetical protein [Phycisphaerae bacterium]